jgi:hypothetical protein
VLISLLGVYLIGAVIAGIITVKWLVSMDVMLFEKQLATGDDLFMSWQVKKGRVQKEVYPGRVAYLALDHSGDAAIKALDNVHARRGKSLLYLKAAVVAISMATWPLYVVYAAYAFLHRKA